MGNWKNKQSLSFIDYYHEFTYSTISGRFNDEPTLQTGSQRFRQTLEDLEQEEKELDMKLRVSKRNFVYDSYLSLV